jgi:hypothetical protein
MSHFGQSQTYGSNGYAGTQSLYPSVNQFNPGPSYHTSQQQVSQLHPQQQQQQQVSQFNHQQQQQQQHGQVAYQQQQPPPPAFGYNNKFSNTPAPVPAAQSVMRMAVPVPERRSDEDPTYGPLGRAREAIERGIKMDEEVTVDLKNAIVAQNERPGELSS